MSDRHDPVEHAVELLKEPIDLDTTFDDRVMAAIRAEPAPRAWARPVWSAVEWMRRGRPVTVSPLGGLAIAAGIAALLLVGRAAFPPRPTVPTPEAARTEQGSSVQFVIVAPTATSVSLVGDFNDWNATTTPMQRAAGDGVWTVTVPLAAGRYRYAFLVDGTRWLRDPSAPPMLEDEFGRAGSVLTIGEL